jgi:hypothetical protein
MFGRSYFLSVFAGRSVHQEPPRSTVPLSVLEFVKKDQLTPEQESELEHFTELEYILQMAKARARRFSLRSKRRRSPLYCLVSRPPEPLADPVFCPFSAAVQRKCPSKHGVYRPSIQAHHE